MCRIASLFLLQRLKGRMSGDSLFFGYDDKLHIFENVLMLLFSIVSLVRNYNPSSSLYIRVAI
jgi:hypothetical protein